MKILVLGLGNDILSDDAAGILIARTLRAEHEAGALIGPPGEASVEVDIVDCAESGISLLDRFAGHEKAIVIDSVVTGKAPPGTIHDIDPAELGPVLAPSPHYSGLPEMNALAREMGVEFPREVRILGLEVLDPYTVGEQLSEPVRAALPGLEERVRRQVREWAGIAAG